MDQQVDRTAIVEWLRQIDTEHSPSEKCIVYVAINTVNNKLYVGATNLTRGERRRAHFYNAKTGVLGKFYTALRKYGPENFQFTTFCKCVDFFHALDKACYVSGRWKSI